MPGNFINSLFSLEGRESDEGRFLLPTAETALANLQVVVLLSKPLAHVIDYGIEELSAPAALGGILIESESQDELIDWVSAQHIKHGQLEFSRRRFFETKKRTGG